MSRPWRWSVNKYACIKWHVIYSTRILQNIQYWNSYYKFWSESFSSVAILLRFYFTDHKHLSQTYFTYVHKCITLTRDYEFTLWRNCSIYNLLLTCSGTLARGVCPPPQTAMASYDCDPRFVCYIQIYIYNSVKFIGMCYNKSIFQIIVGRIASCAVGEARGMVGYCCGWIRGGVMVAARMTVESDCTPRLNGRICPLKSLLGPISLHSLCRLLPWCQCSLRIQATGIPAGRKG